MASEGGRASAEREPDHRRRPDSALDDAREPERHVGVALRDGSQFLGQGGLGGRAALLRRLQRTAGNHAIQQLLRSRGTAANGAGVAGALLSPRPEGDEERKKEAPGRRVLAGPPPDNVPPDDRPRAAGPAVQRTAAPLAAAPALSVQRQGKQPSAPTPKPAATTTFTVNRATYTVTAKTLKEAAAQISQRAEAGETTWRPVSNTHHDDSGKIDNATVAVTITVTMPRWDGATKLNPTDKAKWDSFVQALEAHEQGHVDLARDKLKDVAQSMVGQTEAEAKATLKQAVDDLQAASDAYDDGNDHGRKAGCVIVTEDDAKESVPPDNADPLNVAGPTVTYTPVQRSKLPGLAPALALSRPALHVQRQAPPAAPPAAPDTDAQALEEREKKAWEATSARAGQPAINVWFSSPYSQQTPDTEQFSIDQLVERPPGGRAARRGFDAPGPATVYAGIVAGGVGGVVVEQDKLYFAARLKPGSHQLRGSRPDWTELDWWRFTSLSVYRVDPSAGIVGVVGKDGLAFPLGTVLEPDPDKSRFQSTPQTAGGDAESMRQVAGILPEGAREGPPPKMPDTVKIPPEQYEQFILSYFRARGEEALNANEQQVEKLAETFKPTHPGDPKGPSGVSDSAKKLIESARRQSIAYRDILEKEEMVNKEAEEIDKQLRDDMGVALVTHVTLDGESMSPYQAQARLKKKQDEIKERKNEILALSPVLAQLAGGEGTEAYDKSLLAKEPSAQNDEEIRAEFEKKLDAVRQGIRRARAEMLGSADFVLGLGGLQQRVKSDFAHTTGQNADLARKLDEMIAAHAASEERWQLAANVVLLVGGLFVPGGQFLSALAGFGLAANQMNEHLKEWDVSKAAVDPASALADQQDAQNKLMTDTAQLAAASVALAVTVNGALKGLDTSTPPKPARVDLNKPLSSSGFKSTLQGQGVGVFEGHVPGVEEPVAIKVYPENHPRFQQDMAGARAASMTGHGPKFYGEVGPEVVGQGKRGFAMEKVEGNIPEEPGDLGKMSPEDAARASAQAHRAMGAVTKETTRDVQRFGDSLWAEGHYYNGEVQGLVDDAGHWKPIDFQAVEEVPPYTDHEKFNEAFRRHKDAIQAEMDYLNRLAEANAQGRPPAAH